MQVEFSLAGDITQVKESIPWVRCASGNVFKYFLPLLAFQPFDRLLSQGAKCHELEQGHLDSKRPKCGDEGEDERRHSTFSTWWEYC